MSNPYAPPQARDDNPGRRESKEVLLRRLGAASLAYVTARALWDPVPGLQNVVGGVGLLVGCIYGFLRGRRKFHGWIALFLGVSIALQAYFMNRAIGNPERLPIPLPANPWLEFAVGIIPHAIALTCASALFVPARRVAGTSSPLRPSEP